ncbi:MAG: ABC transporter permease [Acidobacteriota bacterium]
MTPYLARRCLLMAASLILITATVYGAVRLVPGEPTWGRDPGASPHVQAWLRSMHADEPIPVGYLDWLGGLARLDLGVSLSVQPGRPVAEIVLDALPFTVTLGLLAFFLIMTISIPLGVLSAWRPSSLGARAGTILLYVLHALPTFWIALALQSVIAGRLGLLPLLGAGPAGQGGPETGSLALMANARYWILPTVGITLGSLAFVTRFCRTTLLDAVHRPYARAARARGAADARVLSRHGLANTAVPLISLAGLILPAILSGSVLIETIFALPGLGRLFYLAASLRDYPIVMALALLAALATLAANLAADLLYRLVDPRVRLEAAREDVP